MWFGRVVVISRVMIGSRVFVGSCWVSLGVGALGGYEQVLADDVTETGLGTPSLLCRDPPAQLTSDRNITRTSFQGLFHPATTHKSISYPRQGLSELIGPNIPNSKQTTFDDPRSAFPFHLPCLGARLFFSLTLACCRRLGLSPGFLSAKFHDAIDGVSSHQASAPTCPFSARGVALSRVGPEPGDTLLISSSSLPHTHSAPPPPRTWEGGVRREVEAGCHSLQHLGAHRADVALRGTWDSPFRSRAFISVLALPGSFLHLSRCRLDAIYSCTASIGAVRTSDLNPQPPIMPYITRTLSPHVLERNILFALPVSGCQGRMVVASQLPSYSLA